MIVIATGSAILGKILTAIYVLISNANLNAYIGTHKFVDFNQFDEKFILFINGISHLFGACFTGGMISSVDTLVPFAKFFFVIGTIVTGIIFSVKCCIRDNDCAVLSENYLFVILWLGFMLISILMLFTDFSVDITTTRYFCYLPF